MAGCLAPAKARINRVSRPPPKGARRGIGKIVLPTYGDDTWGGDAPQHTHHQRFSLRGKEKGHQSFWWPKSGRNTTASPRKDAAHNPTTGSQSASLIDVKTFRPLPQTAKPSAPPRLTALPSSPIRAVFSDSIRAGV